jgi:hypothetical protein
MAYFSHRLRMALDPAYAAEVRSRPPAPEEETRRLGEALKESTRRIFGDLDGATSYADFKRIADQFGIKNPLEVRRIVLAHRKSGQQPSSS